MPLTILTNENIRTLLHSLTKTDILRIQQSLADALHYYSTSTEEEDNGCCATYQPKRAQLSRKDGSTTLFMPASSSDGMGVKIVTLSEVCAKAADLSRAPSADGGENPISSFQSVSSGNSTPRSILSSGSSTLTLSQRTDSSSSTPFDSPTQYTSEVHEGKMKGKATSPSGSLTLLNKDGSVRGFINAAEITAFRTALASTMLFKKRANVHDVVIFGAGKQAYWHARIALLLRGSEIHHLNFVNRTFDNSMALIHDLYKVPWPVTIPHPSTSVITPAHNEYARHLKSTLRASSVIFCTTPSLEPLFPAEILTSTEGRKKGRYIAAIGSYKPHMIELHTDIIRQAVAPPHGHHHHKHAKQGGAIVVDSVEACLHEAGEITQAGLGGREVVELGELVMLKRDAEARREGRRDREGSTGSSNLDSEGVELQVASKSGRGAKSHDGDGGLMEWLEKGNVIYKSVGLGLMDIVVGKELCDLADKFGVGTLIDGF